MIGLCRLIMRDKTCLQHDKQKTMRNGTLRNLSTLSICLLIVKLMEWRFEGAWKFGLGRLYLG
ncbi:MAG TPA: hypothetical protein DEP74_10395 [Citrobacter freundii]|nr:hypothetical protein [Citrobacter freundii]